MSFYKPKDSIVEALQFNPEKDEIPEGIKIDRIQNTSSVAVVTTPGGEIFVYPGDWVLYDREGLIRAVLKDKNFKSMFERLGK